MIIVKWHLLIWHKRKLCALTNRPSAQSTQTGQWLSKLFDPNCSAAQVYVLHPWQFIFALSCRRRSVLQVFLSSESQEGYFRKKLRITHVRERNLTEARIEPKSEFDRMFRSSEVWIRSVDWTHDMIIVKWHLLIWHKRKLCALTNRPPAQSTQTGQWLSNLFDANCSAAQVYVLHPWQFIFAPSCRRRSVLQVFLSSESQEGYFRKKLRITHVQERNLTEVRIEPKAEFDRMFRSVDPKCGLNTRHDNREVTLTHLTQAQTLRSDK